MFLKIFWQIFPNLFLDKVFAIFWEKMRKFLTNSRSPDLTHFVKILSKKVINFRKSPYINRKTSNSLVGNFCFFKFRFILEYFLCGSNLVRNGNLHIVFSTRQRKKFWKKIFCRNPFFNRLKSAYEQRNSNLEIIPINYIYILVNSRFF